MERTKENVVSCYFTYMQDGWCEEECRTIFRREGRGRVDYVV